jgi:hypothetical protein
MKGKKILLIGLLMATLAASAVAAYQYSSGACCEPACCTNGDVPDCCKAPN